jgi:hypothetical protein
MSEHVPFIWRVEYRTGLDKTTGYDLNAAHKRARQYLRDARAKKPAPPTTGTR